MDRIPRNRPIALVLGGTAPHAILCSKLKQRGFFVVLVDYLEAPPAKESADLHLRESSLDTEKVFQIANESHASLVIATCVDQANVTACQVLERLGKYTPYSADVAETVSNKNLMKTLMLENGIPTSRFVSVSDPTSTAWVNLEFPLIVKPCDSNGSKGVRRCDTREQVVKHIPTALEMSRAKEAVVEEFREGREIAFDSYVQDGKVNIVLTRERRKIEREQDSVQQIYGSFWPATLHPDMIKRLRETGERIAAAFKLDNTPLIVQAIVHGDQLDVIEFAPRIGGGENHRIMAMATGFDAIDAAIDSFLGARPKLEIAVPKGVILDNYLYARTAVYGWITGLEELLSRDMISSFEVYKRAGSLIGPEFSSNNRVGAFTVSASTEAECLRKVFEAIEEVEIYDDKGEAIMIRDIY